MTYDPGCIAQPLGDACLRLGALQGRLASLGGQFQDQAALAVLTTDALKTSEIEGEKLDLASVRSSFARRLGVDIGALAPSDRHVEGLVEMLLDATQQCERPLSVERLCEWQASLFPNGRSGLHRIKTGILRDDEHGHMQLVSGPDHRRRVHFEAPPASSLQDAIEAFVHWFNADNQHHLVIKAAITHLWFLTLHPFEDGNGRIARALSDMLLARCDGHRYRFYSLSSQLQKVRKAYYESLEDTQKGSLDVTTWVHWFIEQLADAIQDSERQLDAVLFKAAFWQQWGHTPMNERQHKVLNKYLDWESGKLTARKWAALGKCSHDTALRDISDLMDKGVLVKAPGGGRSSGYMLADTTKEMTLHYE